MKLSVITVIALAAWRVGSGGGNNAMALHGVVDAFALTGRTTRSDTTILLLLLLL